MKQASIGRLSGAGNNIGAGQAHKDEQEFCKLQAAGSIPATGLGREAYRRRKVVLHLPSLILCYNEVVKNDLPKKCLKCRIELTEENTYKKSGRGILMSWCKKCFNRKTWERFQGNKKRAVIYKGGKCERCGYSKSVWALEFHHRDPKEKNRKIKRLMFQKWDRIVKEIEKCDLLCANCHREIEEENYLAS